jgi:hypothetical protein
VNGLVQKTSVAAAAAVTALHAPEHLYENGVGEAPLPLASLRHLLGPKHATSSSV